MPALAVSSLSMLARAVLQDSAEVLPGKLRGVGSLDSAPGSWSC